MTKKILYIEDDPINKYLVKKVLEDSGHEVFEASDGESGIGRAGDIKPDLILMDMQMPGMDGYEATKEIRKTDPEHKIPIIALTAHALPGDKEKCIAVGCDGYITKPIDIKNFESQIKDYLVN
ncbi:response regulator [Candidatus Margulisiibacteriota bacterium]